MTWIGCLVPFAGSIGARHLPLFFMLHGTLMRLSLDSAFRAAATGGVQPAHARVVRAVTGGLVACFGM
ncbi:MAG TPA: hypothetical protein VEM13_03030 [Gemmatimonadales bacterium]|nr:hypothetical protein [Gemmatimonadales bacterium]